MRELLARVRAALRREAVEGEAARRRPIHEGGLIIDPERMSVTVEGRPVELTPREFALISTLAAGKRAAMGRDEIFRRVWGGERAHGDRSVDVLVRRPRRRLEEAGAAQAYVQTLHGVGYRLVATPGGPQAESRSA
jgi:DNA-binding response OmpR family regulator